MSRSGRDLDEDDVRVRPSRGKSRPRSKDRPAHADATPAMVVEIRRVKLFTGLTVSIAISVVLG